MILAVLSERNEPIDILKILDFTLIIIRIIISSF